MTTESDRELLDLAAKAAGGLERVGTFGWIHVDSRGQRCAWWEPLTDDGDALRLAVKLRIHVRHFPNDVEAQVERGYWREDDGDDPYAATRRAIVRAAAAIARATHKEQT